MAAARRPMDWVTAWEAAMPVFGIAAVLHAVFPFFAVPPWVIFYLYGKKILDGARLAENPWQGRGGPRPYLLAGGLSLLIQLGGLGLGAPVTGTLAGIGALALPALFLSRAAPPGVREQATGLRVAVGLAVASSLAAPGVLLGVLPFEGTGALLVYLGQIVLAAASFAAFAAARRRGSGRTRGAARKVPRA